MLTRKQAFIACLGFLVLLLFSSCSTTPTSNNTTPALPTATEGLTAEVEHEQDVTPTVTTGPTPTSPAAEIEFVPTFENGKCPPGLNASNSVFCGMVTVLEDYAESTGETIQLAVVVFKDQSTNHQPDPVILLAGGPGEKIVANAQNAQFLFGDVHPDRDLIIFDQRGVGESQPALECTEWIELQYELLNEADPVVSAKKSYDTLMQCRDRLEAEGVNLSAYNTTNNAMDVDAIRQSLGYEKLNLLGGSYGSFLAQEIIRQHPEMVRSVVINSVWPLQTSFFIEAPAITSNAVLKLLQACEANAECSQAYPDLESVFFETYKKLNAEPVNIQVTHAVSGEEYDVLLTGDRAYSNLVTLLYLTNLIPQLPEAIYDVSKGDYELLARLQGLAISLYDAMSRGMTFSVVCSEDLQGKTIDDLEAVYQELPEILQPGEELEEMLNYSIFNVCKGWRVEPSREGFKQPVTSDLPTLILEGEFDPVTPIEYARMVAENLSNSYLYEFPGIGHDILVASPCAREIIGDFYTDPSVSPQTTCLSELETGFSIPYQDPEGLYSIPVPPGWTVTEHNGYLQMGSPDGKVKAISVAVAGEDFTAGSETAWDIIDPDFNSDLTVRSQPCQGCAEDDSEAFAILIYQTGNQQTTTLASAWLDGGKIYLIIWEIETQSINDLSGLINTVIMGFEINE